MTAGRIGGVLIVAGCGLLVLAGAIRGDISPVGQGLRVLGDLLLNASLLVIGCGAAVLGIAGPGPLASRNARIGLWLVSFGLASFVVSSIVPIPAGTDSLQSWPYIISAGIGALAIAVGLFLTAFAIGQRSGRGPSRPV